MNAKKSGSCLRFFSVLLALSTLCACARPITLADNGKRYEFPEATEFTVKLAGNPTTGYSWSPVQYDASVIEVAGEPEYKADSDRVGAGGTFVFTLRTVGAGSTEVVFAYARPWEKQEPPAKTFRITVICGTMGVIEAP